MEKILVKCPQCSEKLNQAKEELERQHGLPENGKRQRRLLIKHNHGILTESITLADMLVKDVEATQTRVRATLSW